MGGYCFKENEPRGHLLPGESHGEEGREELERQEAVLSKQEAELTEKQNKYTKLTAQLAEEQDRVKQAKKELSDVLTESEIYKANIQDLNARLKECESSVSSLQDSKLEFDRLTAAIAKLESSSDSPDYDQSEEDRLRAEIETSKAQIQSTNSEYDRLKAEMETIHMRLKETESAIAVLEKKEVEMEQSLGEEMSKHEAAKRRAHLRTVYWLTYRRIHRIGVKFVTTWSEKAKKTTFALKRKAEIEAVRGEFERHAAAISKKIASFPQSHKSELESITSALHASLQALTQTESIAPSVFSPLTALPSSIASLLSNVDDRASSLSEQFDDEEGTLRTAAEIEVFTAQKDTLSALVARIDTAAEFVKMAEEKVREGEEVTSEAEGVLPQVGDVGEISRKQMSDLDAEIHRLSDTHQSGIGAEQRAQVAEIQKQLSDRTVSLTEEMEMASEALILLNSVQQTLTAFKQTKEKLSKTLTQMTGVKTTLQDMLSHAEEPQLALHPKLPPTESVEAVYEEEEVSESQPAEYQREEVELAAENQAENPDSQLYDEEITIETGDFTSFSQIERDEIEGNPGYKAYLRFKPVPGAKLSPEEVISRLHSFFSSLETASKGDISALPRVSVLFLDHFLSSREDTPQALTDFAVFAETLQQLSSEAPGSYISIIARALGLVLTPPMTDFEAKITVVSEAVIHTAANRVHSNPPITPREQLETGGNLFLIDAIKAVYHVLEESPGLGRAALEAIKPVGLTLVEHLNFMVCFRMKEMNMDSLMLFKQIDEDQNGQISDEEFIAGVQRLLSLWMSLDSIRSLFTSIDRDDSDSISRIEFNRAVNHKEYFQKCESRDYMITKLTFLTGILAGVVQWRRDVLIPVEHEARELSESRTELTIDELELVLGPLQEELTQDYIDLACSILGERGGVTIADLREYLMTAPPEDRRALSKN